MDRQSLTIGLALALISCFFLPYLQFGAVKASGFDLLTAPIPVGADKGLLLMKYIWVMIPFAAIMLLIGALNNGKYFLRRGIWAFLPLLTLLIVLIQIFRDARRLGLDTSINQLSKNMAVGYWASLGIALVLAVYWPKQKAT